MMRYKERFEAYLADYCKDIPQPIRETLLSGGHRIRPCLTLCWCELAGGKTEEALPLALAVELVHTMSLIHDDLPCMDNADSRRGKPALHKQVGEAQALLIGDELLARAFALAAATPGAVEVLSRAAVLLAKGQRSELTDDPSLVSDWLGIHASKTAALMDAACTLGVLAAGGNAQFREYASVYGHNLGMAYQLLDDAKDGDGVCSLISAQLAKEYSRDYLLSCYIPGDSTAAEALLELLKEVGL